MAIEQEVAGMRCGEVLAELSDYLDGELLPARRVQLEAHLLGCEACERFGSAFTAVIQALRKRGGEPDGDEPQVFERLRVRLRNKRT